VRSGGSGRGRTQGEAETTGEGAAPADDPWWALRLILDARAPALVQVVAADLEERADDPDEDPWWVLRCALEKHDESMIAVVAEGLEIYASSGGPALDAWLAHTKAPATRSAAATMRRGKAPDQSAKARVGFAVLIDCATEDEQMEVLDEMIGKGRKCRALT
jgi:hypothetical protein